MSAARDFWKISRLGRTPIATQWPRKLKPANRLNVRKWHRSDELITIERVG
jgi:hypothetical protein